MKTYYIVKERSIIGEICWQAYASRLAFYLHIPVENTLTFIGVEHCIKHLKESMKNKDFKRVIVEKVEL